MQTTEQPRLVRRRDDRVIAGVCGGLADHLGIDPTLVRIGAVALTLFGGAGVILYVVAWVLIPEEGSPQEPAGAWVHRGGWQTIAGLVLIGIAVATISDHVWPFGHVGFPLLLIALGAFLLWFRPDAAPRVPPPVPMPPVPPMPPGGSVTGTTPADTTVPLAGPADPTAPVAADTTVPFAGGFPPPPSPFPLSADPAAATSAREWHQQWHQQQRAAAQQWRRQQHAAMRGWRDERRVRRSRRRSVTVPTLGLLAIGAGAVGVALSAGATVDAPRALGVGLGVVGVGLIVAAWYGRASGLIPVGLALLAALTVASAVTVPFEGGVGQRTYRPATLAGLDPEYHVAMGELVLRLSDLHVPDGTTKRIEATVGVGHLLVEVPPDVEVVVRGRSDVGDVQIAGADDSGWKVDKTATVHAGHEGAGRIELDAHVGVGMVEVRGA